jgi:hypothetical protein
MSSGAPGGEPSTTSGGSGGDTSCERLLVASTRAAPDILIVLDRSRSMDTPVDQANRWAGSVAAINQVVAELEADVHFGLMTFPGGGQGGHQTQACAPIADVGQCRMCSSVGYAKQTCLLGLCLGPDCTGVDPVAGDACVASVPDDGDACAAAGLDVPVDLFAAQAIASALSGMFPAGVTPTAQSLDRARAVLSERGDTFAGEFKAAKYVMLVTDGDPNCVTTKGGGGAIDVPAQQATIDKVARLAAAGVLTYVIGFQTEGTSFAPVLDGAALAGATGDVKHRSVNSGAELLEEFRAIAGSTVSCSFVLAQDVDEARVEVRIDGELSTYGDDWSLRDDKRPIDLVGQACDALQTGAIVEAEVFCQRVRLI